MIRATSVAAYEAVKNSGHLGGDRWKAYNHLYRNPTGLTGNEVDRDLRDPDEVNPSFHKRLSELENLGLARIAGTRECQVTGQPNMVWVTTDGILSEKDTLVLRALSPAKPRGEELLKALAELDFLIEYAATKPSEEMEKLRVWLKSQARKRKVEMEESPVDMTMHA